MQLKYTPENQVCQHKTGSITIIATVI